MVALYAGNGSGTKVYQGFLDGHPELYMVPAYPLMYLYPHWDQWRTEMGGSLHWRAIIDRFCVHHASVIDTRRIPGFDGLAKLGEDQSEFIAIDENLFRSVLAYMVEEEMPSARTLLLAVHYAYAWCRGEDMKRKRVLLYHVHVHEYLPRYVLRDFPDASVIATVRDPRSNFSGRYWHSEVAVDAARYNATDAAIYRRRVYYFISRYFYEGLDILDGVRPERMRVVRHEDLLHRLDDVMRASAQFIGISEHPCLTAMTFGGRSWWGDEIYDMKPMNTVNPRVASRDWAKKIGRIDWFVFEGLFRNYMSRYGYPPERYTVDSAWNRLRLAMAILVPSRVERQALAGYLKPSGWRAFLRSALDEAAGRAPLKDYSFNAYYRHKWTQRGIDAWRPRWHVDMLKRALRNGNTIRRRGAQAIYVTVNLVRYVGAILSYPAWIVRRWRVSFAAYRRMIENRNVLPDVLA